LFQRIKRDVLCDQFEPVQVGSRKAGFAGILLKRQISTPFAEGRGELFCQSFYHDRQFATSSIPFVE
jgi:hypothetical protein